MKSFGRWAMSRAVLCHKHKVNFWSALVLIAWAKVLFWSDAPLSPNFRITLMIFDEDHLEAMAFTIGSIQLAAVLSGYKWFRVIASGLAAWLLFTLGYSLSASGIVVPGIAIYVGWGCINLHSMVSVIHRRKREE